MVTRNYDDTVFTADHDLHGRLATELAQRHLPGLRRLAIEVHQGMVTVRGQVRSFYEKQMCQDTCRRIAGAGQFIDLVDVAPAAELAWATASG